MKPLLLGLLLLVPCVGWIGAYLGLVVIAKTIRERGHSEDVILDLPVRACSQCVTQLANSNAAIKAVRKTPLYAEILAKYSKARVI